MKKISKLKKNCSCGCNKIFKGGCSCTENKTGGCANCGLIGGCGCAENQNGGFSLNELSVPFLLLAAKIGIEKINKKTIKGGGKNSKKSIKNTRRREIF
jgi:hypothetical protein